jgi:hypothetical protein
MEEEIHKIREYLFECDKLCQRLSSDLSAQKINAEAAPLIDALRHAVLTSMRVAHAAELDAKLVEHGG